MSKANELSCSFVDNDFLNQYTTVGILGKGSYGSVYLIQSKDGTKKYAVKRQSTITKYHDPGVTQSVLLDADALVRLRGFADVIQLVGVCYGKDEALIIMEAMDMNLINYYRILSLDQRIKIMPLLFETLIRASSLFEQLNITHFDIKPENILVKNTNPTRFAVSDFGLARSTFSTYHIQTTEVFTIWFRPPEFLAGRNRTTFNIYKGDIWAIAVTIIEFILGKPVFKADSEDEMLKEIWASPGNHGYWYNFTDKNKLGMISGNVDVEQLLRANMAPSEFAKLNFSIVPILTLMLSLNPNDRPTGTQIFERVLGQVIDPADFRQFQPPEYTRILSGKQIDVIVQVGNSLLLTKSTLIIAIEIITRYMGLIEGSLSRNDSYISALTVLRIANVFNEIKPVTTDRIVENFRSYMFINRIQPQIKVNASRIASTEGIILSKINSRIYNIDLSPAINRAYEYDIVLQDVPLSEYTKPISQWFSQR